MKRTIHLALAALLLQTSIAFATDEAGSATGDSKPPYLQIGVERVVVDTQGLMQASAVLAVSIERLAVSIERLALDSEALSDEDKEHLMQAVQSVDSAGQALHELAQELPRAVDGFGERLPQAIRDSGQPIADLSDSLQMITGSLPQATDNAKSLVNATLDAAVLRLSIYTFVLFAALALALIAVIWFIYRQYLEPLTRKLDELTGAPEHLEAMARHMEQTSANLLQLERKVRRRGKLPGRRPGS